MHKHQTGDISQLSKIANDIRIISLKMIAKAESGHPGGSLSIAEIVATLYFKEMNFSPDSPNDPDRDRFILSKGHAAPALYSVLRLLEMITDKDVESLRTVDGRLEGHVARGVTPGIEMSTGSLGQGFSVSVGLSLSAGINKSPFRIYAILGDGECQEGIVWEAAMAAAHYKCDNLCAFVDSNGLQIDGQVKDVMNVYPLEDKFRSFGWNVLTINGHEVNEIIQALDTARSTKSKPTAIIANTVKGKGVSFMEGNYKWHGAAPNEDELERALEKLV